MQLKIKIDLKSELPQPKTEPLAPLDWPKIIRCLLIFLILISCFYWFFFTSSNSIITPATSEKLLMTSEEVNNEVITAKPPAVLMKTMTEKEDHTINKAVVETIDLITEVPLVEEIDDVLEHTPVIETSIEQVIIVDKSQTESVALNEFEQAQSPVFIGTTSTTLTNTAISNNAIVKRAQLTWNIVNREPQNNVVNLSLSQQRGLYFFTQINNKKDQTIYHRWYFKQRLVAEISLKIGSNQWRTYSSKNFDKNMVGQWQVQVVDSDDRILKNIDFVVSL